MATRTSSTVEIPKKGTFRYTGQLKDEAGNAIPAANFTTLTLTVYLEDRARTFPIVNGINIVSILNTGRGTVDAQGNLTILLNGLDNSLIDPSTPVGGVETHVMLIQGTYGSSGVFEHEVEIPIRDVVKVA